ncbi:MAG: DUF2877 domain-containing protein [Caldilineaceae bacterium]
MAGLGPGPTPAGDDFLLGFLAALAVLPEQSNTGQDLRHLIVRCASPRTTRLSAAWLYHAGQSQFGELWHELINALNHDHHIAVQQAADAIATTGATSGVDALCGFRAGIEIVRSTPTSRFTPPATPHSA